MVPRLTARALNARLIPWALGLVTFVVFSPALLNNFVEWDDQVNFLQNAHYRGLGWTQIRWMFTATLMGHYIPVTWLTFGLDYTLWGMNPLGYHLTNNLIHAVNAALFYLVALRLIGKASALTGRALRAAGVAATLFFALHPLRAESVAWATERRDVLAGLFFLLTILVYLGAVEAEGARRRRLLAGSLVCYLLALLSKSIVMTLPLVLILLDLYPLRRLSLRWGIWRDGSARAALGEKLPYLALGLAGAVTSYWAVATGHFFTNMTPFGWPGRIAIALHSLWFYLEKTLLPLSLSPLYELPVVVNPFEARFVLAATGVIGISIVLLALHRRWPGGLAAWVYYGIIVGPVSGLVHAGHQLAHDRYSYISCLGWALLLGAAIGHLARAASTGAVRPGLIRAASVAAAAWILALATLTWHQVQVWRDSETLWRFAIEADPRCSICQNNLGTAMLHQGLLPLARERYELALALRPDRAVIHNNLGLVHYHMRNYTAALAHLNIAVARQPNKAQGLTNLAIVRFHQGAHEEALGYLERAIRAEPRFAPGFVNLGDALIKMGRPEAAIPHLLRARDLRPDEPVTYLNLTRAYLALGQPGPAREAHRTLAALDPRLAQDITPTALRPGK